MNIHSFFYLFPASGPPVILQNAFEKRFVLRNMFINTRAKYISIRDVNVLLSKHLRLQKKKNCWLSLITYKLITRLLLTRQTHAQHVFFAPFLYRR